MSAPTLAFAGEPGSFAEDAALAYLPGCRTQSVPTFRDVFTAVVRGAAVGGVVPIENVTHGTVREVYDLLLEHPLTIVGEVELPVRLCLAALPGQSVAEIERVYSHVQALAQAEPFLNSRPWALLAATTTSGAGSGIAARGERRAAAVLSPRAAALYGLAILADDIQSEARNRTRFLILSAERSPAWLPPPSGQGRARTTLAFSLPNEPGSLLRVLSVLARQGINMSKLESRPGREREWEYVFWADLDADLCAPAGAAVARELAAVTMWLRSMGCYPTSS